jgi:CDP-diacylglycerol--serine O-phosphatidyltransferase
VFDALDGRIARLLDSSSKFGAELDSLSDFVSFGVGPSVMLFMWTMHDVKGIGWALTLLFSAGMALRASSPESRHRRAPGWCCCR